jgi:hypothetical protein
MRNVSMQHSHTQQGQAAGTLHSHFPLTDHAPLLVSQLFPSPDRHIKVVLQMGNTVLMGLAHVMASMQHVLWVGAA